MKRANYEKKKPNYNEIKGQGVKTNLRSGRASGLPLKVVGTSIALWRKIFQNPGESMPGNIGYAELVRSVSDSVEGISSIQLRNSPIE